MTTTNILIIALFAAITVFVFFLLKISKKLAELGAKSPNEQALSLINQNMINVQERLDKATESLNNRLDNAAKIVMGVQKELSTVQEIGRGIKEFQEMLNSPKLRGGIGEHILNDSLAQVFSREHYAVQYQFRDGQTVDAVIKTDKGIIPIDSKFPMENFRRMLSAEDAATRTAERKEALRAVKKHIDDIGKKYILPAEGTVDFAVMYVPSENIYYEVMMADEEIMEYARGRKVLLVSPNSFFHFLRVIMMGLERVKLQAEAQRIWELLKGIQQESVKFGETLALAGKHVTNAKNAMDASAAEYMKLSSRIDQVKLLK
ncbi:DNA recombination protein RmuC [Patescibacteria group bacterium]|nr:MAG: DNA recombination protein RmuC [Patescibacteria group bacterium]